MEKWRIKMLVEEVILYIMMIIIFTCTALGIVMVTKGIIYQIIFLSIGGGLFLGSILISKLIDKMKTKNNN
jgi:hypothetical protein